MRKLLCLIALWAVGLGPPPAAAQTDVTEVDVELLLLVDVSRSMSRFELELQRRGYAEALLSDPVLTAVQSGLLGRVAMSYVEWAGVGSQRVVVDWMLISGEDEARAFVAQMSRSFPVGMRRTSIADALTSGAAMFRDNGFQGLRQVIDISGDGPNNSGRPVLSARDAVLDQGIIINGLPLMTRDNGGMPWELDDLDQYYVNCVIGGLGAFAIPVTEWTEFAEAVRRKLVLEMVGLPPPPPILAQTPGRGSGEAYDCEIGEKMWQRTRRYWEQP